MNYAMKPLNIITCILAVLAASARADIISPGYKPIRHVVEFTNLITFGLNNTVKNDASNPNYLSLTPSLANGLFDLLQSIQNRLLGLLAEALQLGDAMLLARA